MTDFDRSEQELPGLEPPPQQATALERAAHQTIAALNEAKLLEPRHALTCQLILDLAAVVAAGTRKGQAAAVALAAAQLREAFLSLPEPIGGDEEDAWKQLTDELREAAREAALRYAEESGPTK